MNKVHWNHIETNTQIHIVLDVPGRVSTSFLVIIAFNQIIMHIYNIHIENSDTDFKIITWFIFVFFLY